MEPTKSKKQSLGVPIAIVAGFGLVAAAIFFSGQNTAPGASAPENTAAVTESDTANGDIAPVTGDDYIRGNPNAPILMVEYSDFDCPFCKSFHETMRRVMAEYGSTGQVAWVYRQFPLEQLHPNAPMIAEASECVGELGGDEAFWKFADLVFDEREQNSPTNVTRLEEFATESGVSATEYNSCMESGRMAAEVEADFEDAVNSGGRGTPHTLVLVGDQQASIKGAQPYSQVRSMIEDLLTQMQGGEANTQEPDPNTDTEETETE